MSAGCTFPQRKEITARLQIREVHIAETEIEIYERRLSPFRIEKEITARLQLREVHIAETEIEIYERRLHFSATERDHGKTADT